MDCQTRHLGLTAKFSGGQEFVTALHLEVITYDHQSPESPC